ncbi:MAG: orotate phosphoribosyltransferase [Saprospiraceae bacterium]|nr:orotate phosphoribosyltransferase [Bacteroidia bacterium]NNE16397.1 orotate phosphoribosyltransferase [Saprospiraceae bacterium]NNL93499.1 orotate phosphoribosyltransferase [Saprospiraceae bacterium]
MSTIASQIANKLLEIKAIKLQPKNPFTWASGLKSPIYCDNRILLSYPEIRNIVKNALVEKVRVFKPFDVVAGVATAGIAHGALLADALDLPFVYVRSKPKGHGMQNLIEGKLPPASKVLVIEDLISTGKSSIAACDALTEAGAEVVGVLAIFSYGLDKASSAFTKSGIPLETLSNYRNLLSEALHINYISEDEKSILETWNKDPQAWADNY